MYKLPSPLPDTLEELKKLIDPADLRFACEELGVSVDLEDPQDVLSPAQTEALVWAYRAGNDPQFVKEWEEFDKKMGVGAS